MNPPVSLPRVLFVDDDPAVLGNLRRSLWREPFEVLTAPSGESALEMIADAPVDVVISDEKMPGIGGAELLTRIRASHPDVCRILLSGQADVEAALRAINDARVFRFLTKPCPPSTIASCVAEALAAREQRRDLEQIAWGKQRRDAADRKLLSEAMAATWVAVQPIVRASDLDAFAFEALARCDHPMIDGPAALFDLAERADAVLDLERLLRHRIAELARNLPDGLVLFVNTHPKSLADPRFFGDANPLVAHAGRIVLELVEREAILDDASTVERIDRLRALGFRIAIDDLGAGYNGLATVAELTPDIVKLDMTLIRDVERSVVKARLVGALVASCRDLGILTVAEGIESDGELEVVRALGCDLLQGYKLGRPRRATWTEVGADQAIVCANVVVPSA